MLKKFLARAQARAPREGALIALVCLGLTIRLLALPYATIGDADSVTRIWSGWQWIANPWLIREGIWGPLHFYLIGLSMAVVRDPIVPPLLLQIGFSVVTPVFLYFFTENEFGNPRASLFVAFAYVFYPIAMRNSLMALSQCPFDFFFVLCLWLLSIARKDRGSWKHAMGAGIAIALAGMLRFEGWTLAPLLAFSLRKRRRWMLIFLAPAAIHPIFWMIGNWAYHDDPLFFYNYGEEILLGGNNDGLTLGEIFRRLFAFPLLTLRGITPVMSLLCVAGTAVAFMQKRKYSYWLIPLTASLCLYVAGAVKGDLLTLSSYTSFLGALLFPYASLALDRLGIARYTTGKRLLLEFFILASMVSFSYPPKPLDELCLHCPVSAIPVFDEQEKTKVLSGLINESLKRNGGGFICDFFGWSKTYYVAWQTRLHPRRIFVSHGARHAKLRRVRFHKFVRSNPRGVLLLIRDSRFARSINFDPSGQARIGATVLVLDRLRSMPLGDSEVLVYRYQSRPRVPTAGGQGRSEL